ncbi:hypothetical protein [Wielerella bovis]|uniref:hypothetical protein n=1 Tax=Wielerella bovis TaxID=2917790 RepID=UPI0020196668|nr:hypothetical protein [Wielerella bovis]MCG7656402.1 hypothetical protein [Wielerella bovis]MCG7658627.1 hypothetical protein [Wielerella bovis]
MWEHFKDWWDNSDDADRQRYIWHMTRQHHCSRYCCCCLSFGYLGRLGSRIGWHRDFDRHYLDALNCFECRPTSRKLG